MDPTAGADPGPHIHHHYAGLGPSLGHHQHYDSHGQGHVHGLMQQPQSQQPPSVLGGFPTAGAHTPVTATFAEQMSGAGTGCEFGSDRIDSVTSGLAQPLPSTVPAAAAEGAAADVVVSAAREATPGSDSDEPGGTDRKLLGFSTPKVYATPLDENGWPAEPLMTAELNGMFFVAEDVFAAVDGGGGTGSISSSGGNSTSGGGGGDDTASSGVSTGTSGPTTIQSQGPRQPGAPLPSRPTELTCYRRNLWQCSGKITLPRQVTHVVMPNGDGVGGGKDGGGHRVRIYELAASIGAVESIEGRPTEIISIPWKTPPPPPPPQRPRSSDHNGDWPPPPPEPPPPGTAIAAPPRITLDLASAAQRQDVVVSPADGRPGSSSSTRTPPTPRVAVPVSWKRLQFKHATANNGRRKGLQQHYVVRITLLGRTTGDAEGRGGAAKGGGTAASSGEWLKIAEISSGPIIVRGRSPRNFNQDRDVPLSADRRQQWERQRRWHSSTTATAAGGSGGVLPGGDAASMTGASAVVDEKQPVVKLENAPQQSRDAHMRLYPSGAVSICFLLSLFASWAAAPDSVASLRSHIHTSQSYDTVPRLRPPRMR